MHFLSQHTQKCKLSCEASRKFDKKKFEKATRIDENIDLSSVIVEAKKSGKRGVVLLGDPGAGKTTGARQLCWQLVSGEQSVEDLGLPEQTIPVFIRLRNLSKQDLTKGLTSFLIRETRSVALVGEKANPGQDLLRHDHLLWVIDGLDEVVNEAARIKVSGWIRQALTERTGDTFLVTSRYQGYREEVSLGADFLTAHIKPLNPDQVKHFIECWYAVACRELRGDCQEASTYSTSLLDILHNEKGFRTGNMSALQTNPLLLTILCIVYHQDQDLPRKRADVYSRCILVLLEHWRRKLRESQDVSGYNARNAQAVLGSISWKMHEQEDEESRTSMPIELMGELAGKALVELTKDSGLGLDGMKFVKRMRDESGILATTNPGKCGFLHLTFQEYLAAWYAVQEGLADELVEKLGKSWWREVILLALGMGSRNFSNSFFSAVLNSDMISEHEELIGFCLEEAQYVVIEPFLDVLNSEQVNMDQKARILRLLRYRNAPGLVDVCMNFLQSNHKELAAFSKEIIERNRAGLSSDQLRQLTVATRKEADVGIDEKTGIAFVSIPAGVFAMGSNEYDDEKLVHQVNVSKFMMGKYPVSNEEFGRFLEANPDQQIPPYWNDSRFSDPRQPVVGVSWDDAKAFCRWASPDFRLPTEAEWEYSCRAGSTTRFCFGDSEKMLNDYAWYDESWDSGATHPVGSKKPNDWGLYDLHGNVWEWCNDWYGDYSSDEVTDPSGPKSGSERVLRGGCWSLHAVYCRSANRLRIVPSYRGNFIGFRVVLAHRSG